MRFYFSSIRIDTDNSFYNPVQTLISSKVNFLDGREYQEIEDGWLFSWTNNTDIEHTLLLAQADITYLKLEDVNNIVIPLTGLISDVLAINRTNVLTELSARGIPTTGIALATTIRDAMHRIIHRIRLLEQLGPTDFGELLNNTVSQIPNKRKKAMNRRLTNMGYDLSGITGSTTIKQVIIGLLSQNNSRVNVSIF